MVGKRFETAIAGSPSVSTPHCTIAYSQVSSQCFKELLQSEEFGLCRLSANASVALTTQPVFEPVGIEGSPGSVSKRLLLLSCTDLSVGVFSCPNAARLHGRFSCCRTPEPIRNGDIAAVLFRTLISLVKYRRFSP